MRRPSARTTIAIAAGAISAFAAAVLIGVSEDEPSGSATTSVRVSNDERPAPGSGGMTTAPDWAGEVPPPGPEAAADEEAEQGLAEGPSGPEPQSADEITSASAAEAYLAAIDNRDGAAVCAALAPGAAAAGKLDLPVPRPSCPAAMSASIGHDPGGGMPVWASSVPAGAISAQVINGNDRDQSTVTVTVVTKYRRGREPSIEDDVIYLERHGGGDWLLVKPSTTLYRAVGIAEVPVSAIAPPW